MGIGTDILEIERITKAAKNRRFLVKCFSERELERFYQNGKISYLAGNFAAKEAVVKSIGTGFAGFWPRDIEILRDGNGQPYAAGEAIPKKGNFLISISHERHYAVAFVVWTSTI